jgi:hypothetical protein
VAIRQSPTSFQKSKTKHAKDKDATRPWKPLLSEGKSFPI